MFLLQLLLAFQDVVFIADNPEVIGTDLASWDVSLWDTWAYYRHSSEWLAGVKATRKWNEARDGYPGWHDFSPGCTAPGYWGDESLPTCNAWYLLLIGVLRLRDGLDFWVRTVEQCLFALSGSVFLLLISGNVRTAYFKFYFKLQCLKRKRAHNRVNVITVTARGTSSPSVTTTMTVSTSTAP